MSIVLAIDIDATPEELLEILTTTKGQSSFWTSDCEITDGRARFGFAAAPVDLECRLEVDGSTVAFTVERGFPGWNGSMFRWEVGPPSRQETGSNVLLRHDGFEDGYADVDRGFTAFTWGLVVGGLKAHAESGEVAPALG